MEELINKQIVHKTATIAVLMAVFLVPFYLVRSQLSPLNNNAFMAGAGIVKGQEIKAAHEPNKLSGTAGSAWSAEIGEKLK